MDKSILFLLIFYAALVCGQSYEFSVHVDVDKAWNDFIGDDQELFRDACIDLRMKEINLLYKTIGMNRASLKGMTCAQELRLLWHDLMILIDALGKEELGQEYKFKPLSLENFLSLSDPLAVDKEIEEHTKVLYRVVGIE